MGERFSHIDWYKRLHTFQTGERQGQYVSERSRKTLEDVMAAKERLTQGSSTGSASVTSTAPVPDDRALFIEAAGGYNRGRVFGLGSEAARAMQQLQGSSMRSTETSSPAEIEQMVERRVEERVHVVREEIRREVSEELRRDFDQRVDYFQSWMTQMSERFGLPIPPMPSTRAADGEDDTAGGSFIPPPDPHPSTHSRPRSPPPPPSAGATAPVA